MRKTISCKKKKIIGIGLLFAIVAIVAIIIYLYNVNDKNLALKIFDIDINGENIVSYENNLDKWDLNGDYLITVTANEQEINQLIQKYSNIEMDVEDDFQELIKYRVGIESTEKLFFYRLLPGESISGLLKNRRKTAMEKFIAIVQHSEFYTIYYYFRQ